MRYERSACFRHITQSSGPQRLFGHVITVEIRPRGHKRGTILIETKQIDPLTTEIRRTLGGRVRVEQFCGRSPEETQKHVEERLASLRSIDELQGEK